MIEQMVEMLREFTENDEVFELLAQCMRKLYLQLVKAGFTAEEAARIVASQGVGIKGS